MKKLLAPRYIAMLLLLLTLGFLTVYPLGMIVYGSFRSDAPDLPGHFTLDGYKEGFSDPAIVRALWNTFSLGTVRTVLTMVLAVFFCWIIVRTDTPFKGALEVLMWINFFIPSLPMAMAWILLLDPSYGLFNTLLMKLPFINDPVFNCYSFWGIVWVRLPYATSVRVLMFSPAFRNMDAALEESARMSGASNFTTLLRITFPILLPAIIGTTMLGFIKSLESFEVELLLGMPVKFFVFSTKVYEMLRWDPPLYPPAMALSTVFLVVVICLVFVNRWFIQRRQYTTVTGKGYRTSPIRLGKWKYVTLAFVIVYAIIFLFLPFSILVAGTFMKISGMFGLPDPFTLKHWVSVLSDSTFMQCVINSIIVCVTAAFVGMTIYSLLSYISVRTKLPGRNLVDFMSWLPWSVPGILLALGLLWVFLGGGVPIFKVLYGSIWLLIIAIIVNQLPMGVRVMDGTMVQINKELEESARMSGAGWFHTFRRVMAPLLIPAYVSTALIMFLAAIREIAMFVLLYSNKSKVLSILMLENYIGMSPEKGMVVGVIISIICIGVAIIARTFGLGLRSEV